MNWKFRLFNVKTTYLYGDIKETVFMALSPGFEKVYREKNVFKLKKSVYSLPQSGRSSYIKFKNTLIEVGLKAINIRKLYFYPFS